MIEVNHLIKDYGDHHAVKDVSFKVEEGQVVGLLGPNGAGKSTIMNILTGYIAATSGNVSIGGCDILEYPLKVRKMVGYLPESPPLYEEMTVDEYLSFVCELKGIRKKKERMEFINRVTETLKINDVRGRLIRNLSKGYKQRVGMAQALAGDPPLLILDEPTSGLDPNQIIEIRTLIRSLSEKHTIILSSHILSEVDAVCDNVLIIDKGKLVAEDAPESLSRHFSGQNHIVLSVKGKKGQIGEILNSMDPAVRYTMEEEDPFTGVYIETDPKRDIREELFFAFADKRMPIVRMEMEKASLEDVFIQLTGKEENDDSDL